MKPRKIIHIDMDCFYAAVEIRDNPQLADKPVAVGGSADRRGIVCTCNYIARGYGIRSAMSIRQALTLCPNLVALPVNMQKYKNVSKEIKNIYYEFTDIVEPLSLDEAYLDVTNSVHYNGIATLIAEAIKTKIQDRIGITASAGVASNKFLAKVGSGWNKPNGICIIKPDDGFSFASQLPVSKIPGVGKVTEAKLKKLNIRTCNQLQNYSLPFLINNFGKFGNSLYEMCRGVDNRIVEPNRVRKSLSVEETFIQDMHHIDKLLLVVKQLTEELKYRLEKSNEILPIKSLFIKIKFNDFKKTTVENQAEIPDFNVFKALFLEGYQRARKPIRLIGVGVRFGKGKDMLVQEEFKF